METTPHWLLVAIIGAVIGLLLPYCGRTVVWVLRRFKEFHLEGEWYEYHLTYVGGNPVLRGERWHIGKGFFAKLSVDANSTSPDGGLRYKGTIVEERSTIVVKFKAISHTEQVACRLTSPIPSHDRTLLGFWLALDFDGRIAVGPEVLTRDQLSPDSVRELFGAKIEAHPGSYLMRLGS